MSPLWALVVLGCVCASQARLLRGCDLVRELSRQGFPRNQLRDWVCLVEHESRGDTGIVAGPNHDGSYDHGLFQINDRFWCTKTGPPGKDCNARCSDLRTADISRAARCARKVYARHNFYAWNGWKSYCLGRPLPDISKCKI